MSIHLFTFTGTSYGAPANVNQCCPHPAHRRPILLTIDDVNVQCLRTRVAMLHTTFPTDVLKESFILLKEEVPPNNLIYDAPNMRDYRTTIVICFETYLPDSTVTHLDTRQHLTYEQLLQNKCLSKSSTTKLWQNSRLKKHVYEVETRATNTPIHIHTRLYM